MTTRRALMIGALGVIAAGPAFAAKIPLGTLSQYLNGMTTVQGKFTQINGDGTISTGQLYLQRPGRIRFDYDAPNKSLVMAGGGQVAVFDPKSNVPPDQFPLSRTPLSIILAPNVDLSRSGMVVAHSSSGAKTTVTAQDPAHPEYGNIQLVFTNDPVELRQWVVTDNTGSKTTVVLGDMKRGGSIGASKFNIPQEINARMGG
ncbi:LolA family protein [Brevirhabdus sp.]|uniref:LolA family protein n=1 Tax=Brevirhabdus sp. TaxID=2004514 RepID=UPI0040597F25